MTGVQTCALPIYLDTWYLDLNDAEESDEAKDIKEAGKDSGC